MTKTVLITGAGGGIGRATVQHFASKGWRVIGVDRVIAPLLQAEAQRQRDAGDIDAAQASSFTRRMAHGDGWPFHHHHIHLSLNWW